MGAPKPKIDNSAQEAQERQLEAAREELARSQEQADAATGEIVNEFGRRASTLEDTLERNSGITDEFNSRLLTSLRNSTASSQSNNQTLLDLLRRFETERLGTLNDSRQSIDKTERQVGEQAQNISQRSNFLTQLTRGNTAAQQVNANNLLSAIAQRSEAQRANNHGMKQKRKTASKQNSAKILGRYGRSKGSRY